MLFRYCALLWALFNAAPAVAGGWVVESSAPPWTEPSDLPPLGAELDASKWGDSRTVLVDLQVRTGPDEQSSYSHRAEQAVTTTGIDDVSTIEFEFDPSYHSLQIHGIWIHRDGDQINALQPADLKVTQREPELDRQIYDGSQQVVAFVKDVRVGDVIEWSSTLRGRNPAMGSHFAGSYGLGWYTPTARLQLRILSSGPNPLRLRHYNTPMRPAQKRSGGEVVYEWRADDLPGRPYEDSLPGWMTTQPYVQVSDFTDWAEVADWAAGHYRPALLARQRMPPALLSKVEEWEQLPSVELRTRAALQFVQDEVRYLGIEIGASGYVPHDPARVFEQRFGDCKDKSLLLVSILNAMGIESYAALVDTDWRQAVADMLPSPYLFDHAVAAARIDGDWIWMDATRSLQRGALTKRTPPGYRRALMISADTSDLSVLPERELTQPGVEIVEEYVQSPEGVTTLAVTTTYRGDYADSMRASLSGTSRETTSRSYLNFYATEDPEITLGQPLAVNDDEETNVLVTKETYRLKAFWPGRDRYFGAWSIDDDLTVPSTKVREQPLAVQHPVWRKHVVRARGIGRLGLEEMETRTRSAGLQFDYGVRNRPDGFELSWELKSLADRVEVKDLAEHLEAMDTIDWSTGYEVYQPSGSTTSSSGDFSAARWIVLGLGLLFWTGVVTVVGRTLYLRQRHSREAGA